MQTSQRHAGCKRWPYIWFVLGLWASTAAAERLPLWEVGVGAGALRIPDYRGAAETHDYPFPFIYPAYRGRILKVDETGVHGMLFESDRLKLDVSLDGAVPVKSDADGARAGMPDLDPTLQFGPALKVKLWEAAPARQSLILNLPLRAVFAIDSSGVDHIGYTASPHLTYYRRVDVAGRPWKLGLSGGLEFGSERIHDYYYQVPPEFTTATRPAYDAGSGYAGTRFVLTLTRRAEDKWMSVFARYDRVDGAVFEDSPLVRKKGGLTAGFVITWFVARSQETVEVQSKF